MATDNYYQSKRFLNILSQYEESEKTGLTAFLDPDDYTDVAEYYQQKGLSDKALQVASQAHAIFPDATAPLAFMARAALINEYDAEKAAELCDQIMDRSDPEYIYIRAEIMLATNHADEADNYLHRELENTENEDDRNDFVIDVTTLFVDYEHVERASSWLAMCTDKEDPDYEVLNGRILMMRQDYEKASTVFNKQLEKDPYDQPVWNYLSRCQAMSGKTADALSSSEFALAIAPNDSEAILNKANALYLLDNNEEALAYYQRYANICPSNHLVLPYLAACCFHLGKRDDYLHYLEASVRLVPDEAQYVLSDLFPPGMEPSDYLGFEEYFSEPN